MHSIRTPLIGPKESAPYRSQFLLRRYTLITPGEAASLNLTALWKKFRNGDEPPKQYGANRDWNVDLIPKYVMANGILLYNLYVKYYTILSQYI
jgi:hypothetical protein